MTPKAKDFTNKPAHRHRSLNQAEQQSNRRKSAVRAKVEHPFLTLKRIWGFVKVRYRGLAKNANRAYAMLALINVSKWARRRGVSCVSVMREFPRVSDQNRSITGKSFMQVADPNALVYVAT